ncbi:DUF2808 domain-containing protein [Leptolyngbya sp. FACHB-321]|uniref:DUF2808 domain-containing protein n=1 Tax=Leptolyngbya sp. FACHB-321 TaxID=2692807 RepID=UPI001681DF73|nr:DUF2808 domain-containing protein [Leptolyngbya sp. FACHB-321]MBD2037691.1 DUF2808 domain-containing protein [Leptolyngbya sp. FACHB-321]
MKSLIYGGLSALLLTTATAAMAEPATRVQAQAPLHETAMVFNFTGPMITNSGVLNSTHFIRVAVIGMSLQELMVSIPSQMERFDSVQVIDQSGKAVPSKVSVSKERLAITFDQPVAPGSYLQVEFRGVRMTTSGGDTLFYGITARRTGLKGEIPVGTARIQVPLKG